MSRIGLSTESGKNFRTVTANFPDRESTIQNRMNTVCRHGNCRYQAKRNGVPHHMNNISAQLAEIIETEGPDILINEPWKAYQMLLNFDTADKKMAEHFKKWEKINGSADTVRISGN